jgi:hypothetical protein
MTRFQQNLFLLIIILVGILFLRLGEKKQASYVISSKPGMIADFETSKPWDISPERGFSLKLSRAHVTEGRHSLQVVFPRGGMPSINSKKLLQKWGDYENFALDIYNPQEEKIDFAIRLDDTNKKRINIDYALETGANQIKISRSRIARQIDPANIRFIVLHLKEPKKRHTLYFDNMRVEGSPPKEQIKEQIKESPSLKNETSSKIPLPMRKAVLLPPVDVPTEGEITLPLAKLKEIQGNRLLISSGIPFAPGQLASEKNIAFLNQEGKELSVVVRVLARWPQDQSIRSVLVQFPFTIDKLYESVKMKWGTPRTTQDLEVVEPRWEYSEGMVLLPAQWLCDSQVIGEQVPWGEGGFPEYEERIEKYLPKLLGKESSGDVRKSGYYSTPHVLYQFYVRTGKIKYFLAARKELLRYRETQIVLEGKDRGKSTAGREPRYLYVDAMADDYFLTGDPRTLEVAGYMAEYLKNNFPAEKAYYSKEDTRFFTERWHAFPFLGVLSYYEMTGNPEYLKVADEFMKNLYKTQMEWPQRGGFIHNLYSHDTEEGARPDEYGGSPFMTGLLLEPIIKYHRLTASEMAADSIFRALDWLMSEGLAPKGNVVKYLTADKYKDEDGHPDLNLLVVHGFGYGYKISGYERADYLGVGNKLFRRGIRDAYLNDQKHFNENFRSSGHYLAYIKKQKPYQAIKLKERGADDNLQSQGFMVFENFDSLPGRWEAGSSVAVRVDDSNVYLNGNSLHVKNMALLSDSILGVNLEGWDMDKFPHIRFAYRIPSGTPLGMRVKTEFGDWICIGGTNAYRCPQTMSSTPFRLIDDNQWHELEGEIHVPVRSVLANLKGLAGFQFYTNAASGQISEYWIDEFTIRR